MLSLGLYQSYISMTITLIIMRCIFWLLEGRSYKVVFVEGLKGIAVLIVGGLMYLCVIKIVSGISQISLTAGGYNSLENILALTPRSFLSLCKEAWKLTLTRIIKVNSPYSSRFTAGIQLLVLGISVLLVVLRLANRSIRWQAKLLTLVLLILLPLGANVSHVLANGYSHELMYDAFWMAYLLLLLLVDRQRSWMVWNGLCLKRYTAWVCVGLVAWILLGNVQMANAVYTSKRIMQNANLSLFTRITYRIEQYPGYVNGETPIAFIGLPSEALKEMPEEFQRFDFLYSIKPFIIGENWAGRYQRLYDYMLLDNVVIAADEKKRELLQKEDVANMPAYPAEGSIRMVDGILVVRLGELNWNGI